MYLSQIGDSGICSENSSASGTEEPSSVVASSTSKNGLVVLDPLSLQLNEAGPITLALAAFLKDMNSMGKPGTVNPGHLFGQVSSNVSKQFRQVSRFFSGLPKISPIPWFPTARCPRAPAPFDGLSQDRGGQAAKVRHFETVRPQRENRSKNCATGDSKKTASHRTVQ